MGSVFRRALSPQVVQSQDTWSYQVVAVSTRTRQSHARATSAPLMLGADDGDDTINLSRSDSVVSVLERQASANGKLPRGWQERLRDDGIIEYYNQKNGVVQTQRP